MPHRILIVDDEESIRYSFSEFLTQEGYVVDVAESFEQAKNFLEENTYDALFLDILLGQDSGIDILKASKELNPNCPVIMITGSPGIDTAAESVRLSAFDYLTKPLVQNEIIRHAQRAVQYKNALDENERYQKRLRAIFEGVQEGILVFNSDLEIIDANYSAMQLLNVDSDILGKKIDELTKESGSEIIWQLKDLLQSRVEGEFYKIDFESSPNNKLQLGININPIQSYSKEGNDLVLVMRDESQPFTKIEV